MAIINKDKYLKDIAAKIQRSSMYFEMEDRPSIEMGGRQVFISCVSLDLENEQLTYTVCNSRGVELPSAHGLRPLRELDVRSLSAVTDKVDKYYHMRLDREKNLSRVSSQVTTLSRNRKPTLSL